MWAHGLNSSVAHEQDVGVFDWSVVADVADVVRFDARGHGQSEPLQYDEFAYRWPAMVDDMLRAGGTEGPFVAGGTSMGAAVSLFAAARAPRRIQALVLATPPVAWEGRAAEVPAYESAARTIERKGLEAYARAMRSHPRPPILEQIVPDVRETWARHLARMDEKVVPAILRGAAFSDLPARDEIRNVIVPTLILAWDGDPDHPVSTAEALSELMVLSELHVAKSLDDVREWPGTVRDFVGGLCRWE